MTVPTSSQRRLNTVACMLFLYSTLLAPRISSAFFHSSTKARPSLALFSSLERTTSTFWHSNQDCWRPTVNDVERISWGKPASKKGKRTGSRGVPHRLNSDERGDFDRARQRGYLELAGSGWRKQRRGAPLLNSFRSLCDARGVACIVLRKSNDGMDDVVTDLSTLRVPNEFQSVAAGVVECVGMEASFVGGELQLFEDESESSTGEDIDDDADESTSDYDTRPIYQLSPYYVVYSLPRSEAKALGKKLANIFDSADPKAAKSSERKPRGVKPGKSRRHGGYGIG